MDADSIITKLQIGHNLSEKEASDFLLSVFNGNVQTEALKNVLLLLNKKGFCVDELYGFAKSMRTVSTKVMSEYHIVDNCGTGGDGLSTFNVSTTSSFIAAAAGTYVAKHGNKAITSSSGSADVLEQSGVNINLMPGQITECLKSNHFGFMFAPLHHASMKHVAAARKLIAPEKTIFNLLGPLTNPANAQAQLIGVFDRNKMHLIAETLIKLGTKKAMIVHSFDGLDEISIFDETYILEIDNAEIKEYTINPKNYFETDYTINDIMVNSIDESLKMMLSVFDNIESAALDICMLNAAALIYVSDNAKTIDEAINQCKKVLSEKKVKQNFENFVIKTNGF